MPHLTPGPFRAENGEVGWRVWAPKTQQLQLALFDGEQKQLFEMQRDELGYFTVQRTGVVEGSRYAFVFPSGSQFPDPASRWQPDGVHQPSAVWFPDKFTWHDSAWTCVAREDLVIYELHVGTFTPEGTFDAIIARLPQLLELGVTAIELMPVAQFPGSRNWGYDGVYPYAAQHSYGGPQGLQRLVDAAHQAGMAVLLDVVYNHLGPEGNYLSQYGPYFSTSYRTPWGEPLNFDGRDSDGVRNYFLQNACYWVRDFHLDGLRLDAVHAIYDMEAWHILAELQTMVQTVAEKQKRQVHVIAESNENNVRLINPVEQGGYNLDGVWNDDFHHAVHALLTQERDGYYADFGQPEHLAKAYTDMFIYNGIYSPYRRRRHGNRVTTQPRSKFVGCVQNHDQIGNRMLGDRFGTLLSPAQQRLACGLLMISPAVPLLFMGEEYGETAPFPFFCSFGDESLIEAIREGRKREFASDKFHWNREPPDPHAEETFRSAQLTWHWQSNVQAGLRKLYTDLIQARKCWRQLGCCDATSVQLFREARTPEAMPVMLVCRGREPLVVACANLSAEKRPRPEFDFSAHELSFSTEFETYGGERAAKQENDLLLPFELEIYHKGR